MFLVRVSNTQNFFPMFVATVIRDEKLVMTSYRKAHFEDQWLYASWEYKLDVLLMICIKLIACVMLFRILYILDVKKKIMQYNKSALKTTYSIRIMLQRKLRCYVYLRKELS